MGRSPSPSVIPPDIRVGDNFTSVAGEVKDIAPASVVPAIPFGPHREDGDWGYQKFSTPHYLEGYANKIERDLIKAARMYNGRVIRLFAVDEGERCPKCTNAATGERLFTHCPVCSGTGFVNRWKYVGRFWTYTDFGPKYEMPVSMMGNSENPGGTRQSISIIGAPVIHDQALAIFEELREVYKVVDIEPHIVAMRGRIIVQIASCMRLTPGSPEYSLITWPEGTLP